MDQDRRAFLHDTGRFIFLTGAATLAWDFVVAGTPEQAPNYVATDHWWGMIIDIDKCIGSGNCVRACKAENDVPLEEGCFRTWVERYQVDPHDLEHPIVDSPNGGYDGFPEIDRPGDGLKVFFVPKMCNHCVRFTVHAGVPGRRDVRESGRRRARRQDALPRLPVLRAGVPVRLPLHRSADAHRRQVHALLSPHHEGPDHGVREVCPTGARQLVDLKNPKDPVHEFIRDAQDPRAQATHGDRCEGLLQRARRHRPLGR